MQREAVMTSVNVRNPTNCWSTALEGHHTLDRKIDPFDPVSNLPEGVRLRPGSSCSVMLGWHCFQVIVQHPQFEFKQLI